MSNNIAIAAVTLCLGCAAGWFVHNNHPGTLSTESRAPTIEQIQHLASLAVLHVPIADVQVYQLRGYTGGIQAALVVKGDVEISTDLTAARLEVMDAEHRHAYLVLPAPTALRPRVDHERTRIYKIDRSGLWQIMPGEAGERGLINKALAQAQQMIEQVGGQAELLDQARSRTKDVVLGFARALDWQIEIRWMDQQAATPPTPAIPTTMGAGR